MIHDYSLFRPVKTAGIFLILFSVVIGAAHVFGFFKDPDFDKSFDIFFLIIFIWHLSTGLGILSQKMWGYYLLKFFLYIMVLSFPIGTYFGVKSLRYLRENNIKSFFSETVIHI